MTLIIVLFGIAMALAGVFLLLKPAEVLGLLNQHTQKRALYILAVVVRLVLGALLVSQAGLSHYPMAIAVIGWIAIGAAVILLGIGHSRFRRLMSWLLTRFKSLGRLAGVVALAFGTFLIHAFI